MEPWDMEGHTDKGGKRKGMKKEKGKGRKQRKGLVLKNAWTELYQLNLAGI